MSSRAWDEITELRERCAEGVERGKQVWAASEYAAYRLALDAPAELSGPAVTSGAGRHTLGPLWEVAASTHTWAELEPFLAPGAQRELVARERVLRGEAVDGVDADTYDIPIALESWEPSYPLASYRSDGADFPEPAAPELVAVDLPGASAASILDDEIDDALHQLVGPWSESDSGSVSVVQVAGTAHDAIAALDRGEVLAAPTEVRQALARLAWAGASGGAHGRRRGASMGRYNAWWAAAHLAGVDWPPDELGAALGELEWVVWRPVAFTEGWELHLAVADPEHGMAWAIAAIDVADDLETD